MRTWTDERGHVQLREHEGQLRATVKLSDGELELHFASLDATRWISQVGHGDTLDVVTLQRLLDVPAIRVTWHRLKPWELHTIASAQWEAWRVVDEGGPAA